ncbi:MAG TPA: DUF5103 domain-containing protein [Saprospiraceae bacterium]|nr:DUF5103 domain-containing protein [Saprospiraceae bacterium]
MVKKSMGIVISFLIVLSGSTALYSQALQDFDFFDYTYVENIRSIQFKGTASQVSNFPVIQLNKGVLQFSFDVLSDKARDYTYRVIHCDRNWHPSNLDREDYLVGFDYDLIRDYQFSHNTLVSYVHYKLPLPNSRYNFIASGNYLLVVYDGNEYNGVPVITRRFMVTEQAVSVGFNPKVPVRADKIRTHQEFDFFVDIKDFNIPDPRREITAVVMQNGNWSTAIYDIKANNVIRDRLNFNFNDRIVFPGLKEFRNFDIRRLEFASQWVQSIKLHRNGTDVLLRLSEPRTYQLYQDRPDINGSFYISNRNDDVTFSDDPNLNSDYANVIFALKMEPVSGEHRVFAIGSFSGWEALPEYELFYDRENEIYLGQALFKQGFYDYMYALVDDNYRMDFISLEGSHYETRNEYNVLVYYSEFAGRFDRLLSVQTFNYH